jgi:CheY-like chemotaxis protein
MTTTEKLPARHSPCYQSSMRILVAEDDAKLRSHLVSALQSDVSDTQIKKNGQRFEKPFCLNAICTAAALPLHHA